uniref:Uncharacterized protein n=1 Tax=Anguilla anguilla TaxID=7936 RepID=A0A0E9XYW9_ANGAN
MFFIWVSKDRSGSMVTPRSLTTILGSAKQPSQFKVRVDNFSLNILGPKTNISVLSEFRSRKFESIQTLISTIQASNRESGSASPGFIEI